MVVVMVMVVMSGSGGGSQLVKPLLAGTLGLEGNREDKRGLKY